jgi:hypothetical protein
LLVPVNETYGRKPRHTGLRFRYQPPDLDH